jgi:hypothetical protein
MFGVLGSVLNIKLSYRFKVSGHRSNEKEDESIFPRKLDEVREVKLLIINDAYNAIKYCH